MKREKNIAKKRDFKVSKVLKDFRDFRDFKDLRNLRVFKDLKDFKDNSQFSTFNFPAWLQRRHGLRPQWSKFSILNSQF